MTTFENPNFLKQKYNLHNAPEVGQSAERTEKQTGEKVAQNPEARIQNYLDRFKEIIERKEPAKRERGMEALKQVLHDKFVIKEEEIPEAYFENQRRQARNEGHGDIETSEEARQQLTEVIIADQKSSLDQWIDYLSSEDATYPDWLKYYAFRSILGMGEYDKEKHQFTKRSKGTTKPFPDINREALAYTLDAIQKKYQDKTIDETNAEFNQYLQNENFAKLYAFSIDKVTPASELALTNTQGEWVKYRQGKDHLPLVRSLQGHGTGWCTAGESTAEAQLQNGDFYVYYSFDENNKPNIPRAAIRMQGGNIAEIRGIAPEQNLDPYIGNVVQKKLKEFPDGEAYEKRSSDMKLLTLIESKTKQNLPLDKKELIFLYEIDSTIEGFGYQKDPRIAELRAQKRNNLDQDMLVVFECSKDQIAHNSKELNENTKAYVGKLEDDIFYKLPEKIEYVYTSFPEGRLTKFEALMGDKTKEEIINEINQRKKSEGDDKIFNSGNADFMIKHRDFQIIKKPEIIKYIRLKVKDLGFTTSATIEEIYIKAKKLGLELCPPETGPRLRLEYKNIFKQDQPKGDYFRIGMKPIVDSAGCPYVFLVYRNDDGESWLDDNRAKPDYKWFPGSEFVFRVSSRKLES